MLIAIVELEWEGLDVIGGTRGAHHKHSACTAVH